MINVSPVSDSVAAFVSVIDVWLTVAIVVPAGIASSKPASDTLAPTAIPLTLEQCTATLPAVVTQPVPLIGACTVEEPTVIVVEAISTDCDHWLDVLGASVASPL